MYPAGFIFDMDGLLVDTERFWQQAEIEVFRRMGVTLTAADCELIMGLRCDEVVKIWQRQFHLDLDARLVVADIEDEVIARARANPQLMRGVPEILDLAERLGIRRSVCSSSSARVIDGVLRSAGIIDRFELLVSAEREAFGKPHPAVYLTALQGLNLSNHQAIVFEDSIHGIVAAKAACLRVVAVPCLLPKLDRRFGIADAVVDSLIEVNEKWLHNFYS